MNRYIPKSQPLDLKKVSLVIQYLSDFQPFLVITGAGASTESGIPDYRSEGVGLYATSKNRPVHYQDFVNKPAIQQRYWARNFVGWPRFSSTHPNSTHHIISKWQNEGSVSWLITQNVDNLHRKAGSTAITELHGSAWKVRCLGCGNKMNRHDFQTYIASLNPGWTASAQALAPDGDINIDIEAISSFNTPYCSGCKGIVKTDVVYFGENVPKSVSDESFRKVEESRAVLIIGSTLETYSALRLARLAHERKKPIIVVNIGKTRCDSFCNVKLENQCGEVLDAIDKNFK